MSTELLPNTRTLISQSPVQAELTELATWLLAERYTSLAVHRHLTCLAAALPRLPHADQALGHPVSDLNAAFDLGHGSRFNVDSFQAARRAYTRFLKANGRLLEPQHDRPFGALRREYDRYLLELRGLSASARYHHAHTIADFIARGVALRMLSTLTQRDIEAFIVLRARELSRHSMQHVVAHLRSFLRFCYDRGTSALGSTRRSTRRAPTARVTAARAALAHGAGAARVYRSCGEVRLAGLARGRRDYALFALMFNTGARVQEVLDLRRRDVRLDPPCQVRLHGKGSKVRLCPIWPATARLLRDLMPEVQSAASDPSEAFLFTNARGNQLTRFGLRYLLRKYVAAASRSVTTLREKRIHPHSVRHSTAVALLKAVVDFATISQWLGHTSLNTTMRYARADLDLKRQALSQVFPDALAPPRGGHLLLDCRDLVGWMRRMSSTHGLCMHFRAIVGQEGPCAAL